MADAVQSTGVPWHLRRPLRALASACTILAAGVLSLWLLGLLVNDRFVWSQFLWWMPGWVVLPTCAALLAIASVLRRAGWVPALGPRVRSRLAIALWIIILASGLWCLLVAWRFPQSLLRPKLAAQPAAGNVRVLHWNPSIFPRFDRLADDVAALQPDIAAIANPPISMGLAGVAHALPKPDGSPASVAIFGRLAIFSRFSMLRWGGTELRITGSRPRVFQWEGGGNISIDQGQALLAELDTREALGRTTVVWLLDLPSDPDIPRARMAREARETLLQFPGVMRERTPDGLDAPITPDGRARLLTPDIIVGDLNITRGSRSLRELVGPAMRHAYDDAGAGLELTFPRFPALLAIDNAFVAASLRTRDYRVIDVGAGKHRAQVVEVVGGATGD